jgi:hypothetical protein
MLPDPAAQNEIVDAVDVVEPASAEPNLLLQTWWEGDRPAVVDTEPAAEPKSVAWPMSAVMSAIQLPANRFERWRGRRLT